MKKFSVIKDAVTYNLCIRTPKPKDIDDADTARAVKVASIIKSEKEILSKYEIEDYLRKNKIWTKKDEDRVSKLQSEVHELLEEIRRGGKSILHGRKLCIFVTKKRMEIINIMSKRRSFDDSTIEARAEAERDDYIIYASTVTEDTGELFWPSFEDFKEEKNTDAYIVARRAFYELINQETDEFEKRLPENRWLKKYNFIDENFRYIDRKSGNFVDENGDVIKPNTEAQKQLEDLQGEIKEESPYIDDETNQPISI